LAKTSRKSTAKRPVKKKASAAAPAEDDHVDGCDIDFANSEPTADADLPAASGGVEIAGAKRRR
jgi:hypothetical protein